MSLQALCRTLTIVCIGCAGVAGCGGAQESEAPPPALAQKTVDQDRYSAVAESRTVVVADASAWGSLWAEHKRDQDPVPRAPLVDFSQQMVLGVFAGARPTSCGAIVIQKVYRANGRLVVEYAEPAPDPAAVCAELTTHPSQMVAVPRGPGPVEFIKAAPR